MASTKMATINGQSVPIGGDVIIAINEQSVASFDDLHAFLSQAQAGQVVTITVLRDGKQVEVPLTLTERPKQLP